MEKSTILSPIKQQRMMHIYRCSSQICDTGNKELVECDDYKIDYTIVEFTIAIAKMPDLPPKRTNSC